VKASVTTTDTGSKIHMVLGIAQESPDNPARIVTQECAVSLGGVGEASSGSFFNLVDPNSEVLLRTLSPVGLYSCY